MLGTTEDTGQPRSRQRLDGARDQSQQQLRQMSERNLGPNSAVKLPRGLNNLWNKGGLMYAYPVR